MIIELAREAGAAEGVLRLRRAPGDFPTLTGIDMPGDQ